LHYQPRRHWRSAHGETRQYSPQEMGLLLLSMTKE